MERLKGFLVLNAVLVVIALPFLTLFNVFTGDVRMNNSFEDEYVFSNENQSMVLDASDELEENLLSSLFSEFDSIADKEEIICVNSDVVPLNVEKDLNITISEKSNTIKYNVATIVSDSLFECTDTIDLGTAVDLSSFYCEDDEIGEMICEDPFGTKIEDYVPLNLSFNSQIINDEIPEYEKENIDNVDYTIENSIIDQYVPLAISFDTINNEEILSPINSSLEYPTWILENNANTNVNDTITDDFKTIVPSSKTNFVNEAYFDSDLKGDVLVESIISENICKEEEIQMNIFFDINDAEMNSVVEEKNESIEKFINFLENIDEDEFKDEIVPLGLNNNIENYDIINDIKKVYNEDDACEYEVPIYYIDYVDGIPVEKYSTFIISY